MLPAKELNLDNETAELLGSCGELVFHSSVRTDVGRKRTDNQDSYGVLHSNDVAFYVVADGMGGANGGATASAMAVNMLARGVASAKESLSTAFLKQKIIHCNTRVFQTSREQEELTGMGSTVVCLALTSSKAFYSHAGDSRLYLIRNSQIQQLTRDHTLVQDLLDSGTIKPDQSINNSIGHMLTEVVGHTNSIQIEASEIKDGAKPGDKFLLCCDGVTNYVKDDEFINIIQNNSPVEATNILIDLSNKRGGKDNSTAIVIHVEDYNKLDQIQESTGITIPAISSEDIHLSTDLYINGMGEFDLQSTSTENSDSENLIIPETEHLQTPPSYPAHSGKSVISSILLVTFLGMILGLALGFSFVSYQNSEIQQTGEQISKSA